jgi:ABC-type Fe3+/spermidine/putrescine transport system ATPase subunit
MSEIVIDDLHKSFGGTEAVRGLSISIEKGELVSLLGPSGCGKTTLLRLIAGFETPTSGAIYLRDRNITEIPPQKRNIGIVFQDYAVFPTMTVFENVAYGLKVRKLSQAEIQDRVAEYLALVGLTGYEKRLPSQLSGGQQQRVALARALVIKPDVLLLDEPLSNLDAALRLSIRKEIRKIQQALGITTVFVTHDQEEALSISDKVFVMRQGELMHGGSPAEIYRAPKNDFVAGFIGKSNILYGTVTAHGDTASTVQTGSLVLSVADCTSIPVGSDVWISLRPQYIRVAADPAAAKSSNTHNQFSGTITYREFLGGVVKGEISVSEDLLLEFEEPIQSNDANALDVGQAVTGTVAASDVVVGRSIRRLD